ncbi:hypothetical protein O3P69_001696 [Scylla paramamosain]|uniref:Uncharacterized protein n=1 Tax=Scylla paramamosain TaxID=85552 RepID=A0AAW0V341_SCYPA
MKQRSNSRKDTQDLPVYSRGRGWSEARAEADDKRKMLRGIRESTVEREQRRRGVAAFDRELDTQRTERLSSPHRTRHNTDPAAGPLLLHYRHPEELTTGDVWSVAADRVLNIASNGTAC